MFIFLKDLPFKQMSILLSYFLLFLTKEIIVCQSSRKHAVLCEGKSTENTNINYISYTNDCWV